MVANAPVAEPALAEDQPVLAHHGAAMLLEEFAAWFRLLPSVTEKFPANQMLDAEFLCYLSKDDVRKELGLSIGDYGNYLSAKEKWELAAAWRHHGW